MKRNRIARPTVSLENIHYRGTCIGIEALSVHRPNLGLITKVSQLYDDVSSFVREEIQGFASSVGLASIPPKKAVKLASSADYGEIMSIPVPVVPGLRTPWLDFIKFMEQQEKVIASLYDKTLYPFSVYVGTILNDPEKFNSSSFKLKAVFHDLKSLRREYAKYLGDGEAEVRSVGKVFRRSRDIAEATARIEKLLANSKKISPKLISETVQGIDDNLNLLLSKMKDANSGYHGSSSNVNQLTKLIQGLAEEITIYSLYINYVEKMAEAMKQTCEKLAKG